MGRKSKSDGVRVHRGKIQLDFFYQLQRCRPTLDLPPTNANLIHARKLLAGIKDRIRVGTFDFAKEFPAYKALPRVGLQPVEVKTFKQYAEMWLGTKGKLSPSTLDGYRKVFNAHWYQWCGDETIGAIKPSEIALRMGTLAGSRKTHNNVLDPGRQVFELAKVDGAIPANPCDGINYLELPEPEPDPYERHEIELILPKMLDRWGAEVHDYYEFAFFTGLRPSEQIELRWDDIDLQAKTLRITRARVRKTVKPTKTYYNRTVELNTRAYSALLRQKARTYLQGGYVFLSPFYGNGRKAGEPWADEHRQGEMFRSVVRLLGIRHRPAKNTRHTYATILLMAGVKPAWAAAQLGHSLEMFLRVYSKWIPGGDKGVELAKVEAFTSGDKSGDKSSRFGTV